MPQAACIAGSLAVLPEGGCCRQGAQAAVTPNAASDQHIPNDEQEAPVATNPMLRCSSSHTSSRPCPVPCGSEPAHQPLEHQPSGKQPSRQQPQRGHQPTQPSSLSTSAATAAVVTNSTSSSSASSSSSSTAAASDLSDVPLDVLAALILPRLPPGHRLDLRAVNRRWAGWVDGTVAPATHINLVMDATQLEAVAAAMLGRQRNGAGVGVGGRGGMLRVALGGGTASDGEGGGLLVRCFPGAVNVRLWIGCRPSAVVAGNNGGGAAAETAHAGAAAAARRGQGGRNRTLLTTAATATDPVASTTGATCSSAAVVYRRAGQMLYNAASSVLGVPSCWVAGAPGRGLAALGAALEWRCEFLRAALQRLPQRAQRDTQMAPPPGPRWHVHRKQAGSGGQVKVLRRYTQETELQRLPPLAGCLPLLGGSTALTRLSLVSTYHVTRETLSALTAAFPNLTALALHAHHPAGVDPAAVSLGSLAPLLPPGATLHCRRGYLVSADSVMNADQRICSSCGATAATALPALRGMPLLRTLSLCGLRLDTHDGCGLGALTQLRALVLHRVTARVHRLLPNIRALTQLTRLEMRRLDYHHSLPLDCCDTALLEAREQRLAAARARRGQEHAAREAGRREHEAQRQLQREWVLAQGLRAGRVRSGGRGGTGEGLIGGVKEELERMDDEHELAEALAAELELEEEDVEGAPWLRRLRPGGAWSARACPDWAATLWSLGRAVGGMGGLRVLVLDAECPAEGLPEAWSALLAGVRRLSCLQELRLSHLALRSGAHMRALAAALPELTVLELGALPSVFHTPAAGSRGEASSSSLHPGASPNFGSGNGGPCKSDGLRKRQAFPDECALRRHYLHPGAARKDDGAADGGAGESGNDGDDDGTAAADRRACRCPGLSCASKRGRAPPSSANSHGEGHEAEVRAESAADSSGIGGGTGGSSSGVGGGSGSRGLSCFRRLRELVLRRVGVQQMVFQGLPLPAGLQRLELPIQSQFGRNEHSQLTFSDLLLLHSAMLPALSVVPSLALTLGPARGCEGPLLVAMLGAWLRGGLAALNVCSVTHPANACVEDVEKTFRRIASDLPRLRRLSCHLWGGPDGLLQPVSVSASDPGWPQWVWPASLRDGGGGGNTQVRSGGGGGQAGPDPWVAAVDASGVALGGTAMCAINALPYLDELRIKVLSPISTPSPDAAASVCRTTRVPLGLLRGLERPLRVVDCSSLDAWCQPGRATDPRAALAHARATLAANGSRCSLVSEAEEWAAAAMGLGPDMEAAWRA